jgi:hypothetical protein
MRVMAIFPMDGFSQLIRKAIQSLVSASMA